MATALVLNLLTGILYAQKSVQQIIYIDPPYFDFFAKYLNSGGIPVRSSGTVEDKALQLASAKISLILANTPQARYNLVQWGAEMHIIGRYQHTSDLPEYRSEKGKTYTDSRGIKTNIDDRTRGKGGIYTSCGEENLLGLKEDRYAGGSDICIHEFAHAVMDFGFDEEIEKIITAQFRRSIGEGLWKGAYAATDQGEYWAELTMWYFGGHGEFLSNTKLPAPGKEGLRLYDPEGYELLDRIYSGRMKTSLTKVLPATPIGTWPTTALGKQRAFLMIVNDTPDNLKVSSVESDRKEKLLPDVPPYSRRIEFTYLNRPWKIQDRFGRTLGLWKVNTKYGIINPVQVEGKR